MVCFHKDNYDCPEIKDAYSRFFIFLMLFIINCILIYLMFELTRGFVKLHTRTKDQTIQECLTMDQKLEYNSTAVKYYPTYIIILLSKNNISVIYEREYSKKQKAIDFLNQRPIGEKYSCMIHDHGHIKIMSLYGDKFSSYFVTEFYGEIIFFILASICLIILFIMNICLYLIWYYILPNVCRCIEYQLIHNNYEMV